MSRALARIAVVDVFFAAAVPAGGAAGNRGKLPKAFQLMSNAATWKKNQYLGSGMQIGERWELLNPILMQICKIARPGNVHEKFIGAISSVKYSQMIENSLQNCSENSCN